VKWQSALAVYALFWVLSAFFVMPFGVKTADEVGVAKIPGQAESAPANFNPLRIVLRTTIVASVLFGLFVLNLKMGWITLDMLTFFRPPRGLN
jgi:predicted secreted protein